MNARVGAGDENDDILVELLRRDLQARLGLGARHGRIERLEESRWSALHSISFFVESFNGSRFSFVFDCGLEFFFAVPGSPREPHWRAAIGGHTYSISTRD